MNDNTIQAKGFLVWGICALFFLYEFFLRTVLGTYQSPLMQDLELTSFQFSLLSTTIFLLIYGVMQIPVGLIVDNIGLKKSLLIGSVCCTAAAIGFAFSYNYSVAVICRLFMGFGASFGFVCMLISVHDWMPHKYSAVFMGISQFIGTLGPMMAAGPLENLSHSSDVHWRYVFLVIGAVGAGLVVLIFFFVENNRQQAGKYLILYKPENVSTALARLFTRIQPWYIALVSAGLYFSIEYLSENEGRSFLMSKGISQSNAGYMLTIAWIGYALGCTLLGFISDILQRRKIILSGCGLLSFISIIMLLYLPGEVASQIAFFMLGFSASGQSIGFAIMSEQFKKQFLAVGFGLNNAIIMVLSAINAPVFGLLLDSVSNGKPVSLENYQFVFNILVVIAFAVLLLSIFLLKETFCKSEVDFTFLTLEKK